MLLTIFLESSLLLLVAIGLTLLSAAPALRSRVLFLALLALPLLLLLTTIDWSYWQIESAIFSIQGVLPSGPEVNHDQFLPASSQAILQQAALRYLLPGIYLVVVTVLVFRQLSRHIRARWVLQQSHRCNDRRIMDQVDQLGASLGVCAKVNVVLSAQLDSPGMTGHFRPTILLPVSAVQLPLTQLRHLLAHELSHIERNDWLKLQLSELVCAVFCFQPLAWWALHRASTEMELACDYTAIHLDRDPVDYATTLARWAMRGCRPVGLGFSGRSSALYRRVARILAYRRQNAWSAGIAAAFVAAVAIALSVISIVPPATQTPPDHQPIAVGVDAPVSSTASKVTELVSPEAATAPPASEQLVDEAPSLVQPVVVAARPTVTSATNRSEPKDDASQISIPEITVKKPELNTATLLAAVVDAAAADQKAEVARLTDERWRRDDHQAQFTLALSVAEQLEPPAKPRKLARFGHAALRMLLEQRGKS